MRPSSSAVVHHIIVSIAIVSLLSACSAGPQAVASESWTVIKLLTQGESIESITETVEVRNCCGAVERKTVSCSAGTSSELNVNIGASIGFQAGGEVSIDPSVGAVLGFSRDSGESLELDPAPEGFTYLYRITKTYTVIAGEALVRSSSGNEQSTTYRFQAKCSLRIEPIVEKSNCQDICTVGSQPTETPQIPSEPSAGEGKVVFDSPVSGKWQVFSVNADGSDLRQLTSISKGIGDPAISPDGRSIVFVGDDGKSLYVMRSDGTQIQDVYQTTTEVGWPTWSFDSQKIVFAVQVDGYKNLYMMNANGTIVERLTNISANDLAPSFSPDGSQVVFSSTRSGSWEIYKLNIASGEIVRLTDSSDSEGQGWPSWSPDGTKIAFESRGDSNSRDIFTMYSDGSQVTNITNSPKYEGAPVWSSDSTRIAFASDRDGSLDIYIMNSDGSGMIRLTTIWAWGPSWSFYK